MVDSKLQLVIQLIFGCNFWYPDFPYAFWRKLQLVIQLIFGCNFAQPHCSAILEKLQLVIQLIFGCNGRHL